MVLSLADSDGLLNSIPFELRSTPFLLLGGCFVATMCLFRLLSFQQVSKERLDSLFQVDPLGRLNKPIVFGHRGGGFEAPENTIAALRKAKQLGITGVEIDIALTSDSKAVVIHDDSVDRTCDGRGMVRSFSYDDIKRLNAAHYFDPTIVERVPHLDEVVNFCLEHDLHIIFDMKLDTKKKATIDLICQLYARHPRLYDCSMVSSFNVLPMYLLRWRDPKIVTGLGWQPDVWYRPDLRDPTPYQPTWRNLQVVVWMLSPMIDHVYAFLVENVFWRLLGYSVFVVHGDIVSKEFVNRWAKRGVHILPYTVNSRQDQEFFFHELNIPYITDWPSRFPSVTPNRPLSPSPSKRHAANKSTSSISSGYSSSRSSSRLSDGPAGSSLATTPEIIEPAHNDEIKADPFY